MILGLRRQSSNLTCGFPEVRRQPFSRGSEHLTSQIAAEPSSQIEHQASSRDFAGTRLPNHPSVCRCRTEFRTSFILAAPRRLTPAEAPTRTHQRDKTT